MRAGYSQLDRKYAALSKENKLLRNENRYLAEINKEFGRENDELHERIDRYSKIRLPKSRKNNGDDNNELPSNKRQKVKGKEVVRCTDDEIDPNNQEGEERNEKGARVSLF